MLLKVYWVMHLTLNIKIVNAQNKVCRVHWIHSLSILIYSSWKFCAQLRRMYTAEETLCPSKIITFSSKVQWVIVSKGYFIWCWLKLAMNLHMILHYSYRSRCLVEGEAKQSISIKNVNLTGAKITEHVCFTLHTQSDRWHPFCSNTL